MAWIEPLLAWGEWAFYAFWVPTLLWTLIAGLLQMMILHQPTHTLRVHPHRLSIWWSLPIGWLWANWGWLPAFSVINPIHGVDFVLTRMGAAVNPPADGVVWFTGRLAYGIPLLGLGWIVLRALLRGLHLIRAAFHLHQIRRQLLPLQDVTLNNMAAKERAHHRIWREVQIGVLPSVQSPFTFGILRPVLVLPAHLLSDEEVRFSIIRHEFIHIRRWDVLKRLLEEMVLLFWGWHPLLRSHHHEIMYAREASCDAEVLASTAISKPAYAALLYRLLASESVQANPLLSAMALAQTGQLKRRIQQMKELNTNERQSLRWGSGLLFGLAIGLLGMSGVLFRSNQSDEQTAASSIQTMRAAHWAATTSTVPDTTRTLMVNGKRKNIRTISVRPAQNKPVSVVFKDGTQLNLTIAEAQRRGIALPPPPPPPPPPVTPQAPVIEEVPVSAEFPGGIEAMQAYLLQNVRFPDAAKGQNVNGRVFVHFVVGKDGAIEDAKVVRSLQADCDAEALRVIREMPKWKPAMQLGEPVPAQYTMAIQFMNH